ncbi:aldo-keto reductase family 4 member C9-like [Tripterygium wilfordii]|uniref:Aldo-keto reductase family 4 member C9-like n=1 Tax=Tripterygium wilfordii TaxID=458696 RepID=A0A7J7DNB2_TRIWF|nr:aldo-keto reductase family 4 member C9-like [Tripterygium wilfordii]
MASLRLAETWTAMGGLYASGQAMTIGAYSPLGSQGSWIKGEILKEPSLIEIAEKR